MNELFSVLLSTFCGWRSDGDKVSGRESDGANVQCLLGCSQLDFFAVPSSGSIYLIV